MEKEEDEVSPKKTKPAKHKWGKWSKWSAHGASQEKSSRRCDGDDCPGTTQTMYRKRANVRG